LSFQSFECTDIFKVALERSHCNPENGSAFEARKVANTYVIRVWFWSAGRAIPMDLDQGFFGKRRNRLDAERRDTAAEEIIL
jgi:hypothetical protein